MKALTTKKSWYQFESPTTGYVLNARINDNGTFVFYANRKGEYFLFEPTGIDRNVTLALDDMNGIELYRTGEGDRQYLEGEYFIDENGYYQALFPTERALCFCWERRRSLQTAQKQMFSE